MAGGKETPRQKMIGMMYLVLTALLALNVSKSILDAFVNIEENIQVGNITEYDRGFKEYYKTQGKLKSVDSTGKETKSPRAEAVFTAMEKIDKLTAEKVQFVDKIKLMILQSITEDLDPKAEKPILILDKGQTINFQDLKNPRMTKDVTKKNGVEVVPFVKPIRMNLRNVAKKDAYDEQMLLMGINESIESPKKDAEGFKVWNEMLDYRSKLPALMCEAVNEIAKQNADSTGDAKVVDFKDPKINAYKDINDLNKKLDGAFKSLMESDVNLGDEIKKIYAGLTKNEKIPDPKGETGPLHWIGMTFDHAPSVAAIAALSGLQSEILTARADALTYLGSLVGGGTYSFNAVEGRAFSPPSAAAGATVRMDVMMVAYDSEKNPTVVPDQGKVVETRDGKAIVEFTAPSGGEMVLSGSVSIADKNGQSKTERYETTVQVVTKAGSVSLPEMNILYAGWPHKLLATTAGTVSTSVTAAGASISAATINGQQGYTIRANTPGRTINVNLTGKDADGNTINFGSYPYDVKPFPMAKLVSQTCSRGSNTRLRVTLGADCPLNGVTFTVTGGTVYIGADKFNFNGPLLKKELLRKAMPGRSYAALINYKRDGSNKTESIKQVINVIR
jgi:hypothetical protein